MFFDRSPRTWSLTEGGSCDWNVGSRRRTLSVTSIVLLPGCRMITSVMARAATAGLPSRPLAYSQDEFLSSSTLSLTVARSCSRTGAPLRYVTTIGRNAAASFSMPFAWTLYDVVGPYTVPVGTFTFQFCSAASTSFSPTCRAFSLSGSTCTRTAYFCEPKTCTCATPCTIEMRCAIMRSPYSSSCHSGSVGDVSARNMMGSSAGLYFRNDGGEGMPAGSSGVHSAMAACTSTAAPPMSRLRSNCNVIEVLPVELDDVIESKPAMVVNWRSSGVATADAMVFGSPPGRLALTTRVG